MWIRKGILVSEKKNSGDNYRVTESISANGISLKELKQDIEKLESAIIQENKSLPFYNENNTFKYIIWNDIQEI